MKNKYKVGLIFISAIVLLFVVYVLYFSITSHIKNIQIAILISQPIRVHMMKMMMASMIKQIF